MAESIQVAPNEDPEKCYNVLVAERVERVYINDCLRH